MDANLMAAKEWLEKIPSDGNPYDHKNKCAYEGDDDDGNEIWEGWTDNKSELTKDVANRIEVKMP